MTKYVKHNIRITLDDGIDITSDVESLVETHIAWQTGRPLRVCRAQSGKLLVRRVPDCMLEEYERRQEPILVPIDEEITSRIYPEFGSSFDDLTEKEIEDLKRVFTEPIFIEFDPDFGELVVAS